MYGWRGKIGHVSPSRGDTMVHEFYQIAPDGMMFLNTTGQIRQLDKQDLQNQYEHLEWAAKDLVEAGANVVLLGGGPIFSGKGYEKAREICLQLEDKLGVPVQTTICAAVEAMKNLAINKVVIASPYEEEHNNKTKAFLEEAGFIVLYAKGLGIKKNSIIGNLPTYASYQLAKEAFYQAEDADCVYMPCGRWPTVEYLDVLEEDLGKPAISSTSATFWYAFKALKTKAPIKGFGMLLDSLGE
ncbi:aspartate/glutamate racemase family protein [Paradesulfitobacterium aromaticivorans]